MTFAQLVLLTEMEQIVLDAQAGKAPPEKSSKKNTLERLRALADMKAG